MPTPISIIDFDFNEKCSFYETPYSTIPHFILNTKDRYGCIYCRFGIHQESHDGEISEYNYDFSNKTINSVLNEYVKYVNKKAWNPYPKKTPKNNHHYLVHNKDGQMRSMTYENNAWKHPEFGIIAFRELPEI